MKALLLRNKTIKIMDWIIDIEGKTNCNKKKPNTIGKFYSIIIPLLIIQMVNKDLIAQSTLQSTPKVYTFIGNGNWSKGTNWQGNINPPGLVQKGDSIIVQTSPGDSCVLDIEQYLAKGAVLKVVDESSFIVKNGIVQFVPADSFFTDTRDGQIYPVKKYGTQIWMTKNLNYNLLDSEVYNHDTANASIYGRLYSWDQATSAIPAGWHLPSVAEWYKLYNFLGGIGIMKDTLFWDQPNTGATNISGFTARPGGFFSEGEFELIGKYGQWWTSSEYSQVGSSDRAHYIQFSYVSGTWFSQDNWYKYNYFLSIRCVKD